MDTKQTELFNRLEELKKHQEEEEKLLKAQRRNQQALLTREQIKMYEMLGVNVSNAVEVDSGPIDIASESENEFDDVQEEEPEQEGDLPSSNESSYIYNYNNELVKNDNILSTHKDMDEFKDESEAPQIKRPFLKRGSGLTNRFRIPPDAFNLKKLPRYKYAERINKFLAKKNPHKAVTKETAPRLMPKDQEQPKKKPPALVKKNQQQILPSESAEPENTELVVPENFALKLPVETVTSSVSEPPLKEWFSTKSQEKREDISETPKLAKLPKGVSWAQVLNSNEIVESSIDINHLLNITNESELDETSLFHLLENRVNNMSLNTSISTILKFLATVNKAAPPVDEEKTLMNPEDPLIDDISSVNLRLEPHPTKIDAKIIIDETTEDSGEETADDDHRVRFADNVEVVGNATDLSTDLEAIELSMTSTPNERQKFQDFKRNLMGRKPSSEKREQRDDLKEKSDQLKSKLMELEAEISSVRQQNADLARRREDFELDKIKFQNDREDMMEQLKDDRIKMELQLHDERVKLDQEKQKFERMLKNPTKKEREEITKLKETVDELKEDLKLKEVRHGSMSARYRSQIKQLEKENQSLKLELDVFKKENKKLELENARLRKDTNNKMLQEINKNIAKLAPQDVKKQPEMTKKSAARKSEPVLKKRTKSVPNMNVQSSSDSSSEDESVINRKFSKENNPLKVRRSDPVQGRASSAASSTGILAEMKREIENSDGSKDIWYPNGNLKKISPDGMLIRMLYFNKDIKETNINEGTIKYYYNETNTWHTTYIDGLEILEYPDGQVEHRYKDGKVEFHYENGSIRITNKNWTDGTKEEWRLPDGTNIKIFNNESKILTFPNGQREIHTANHKRREYPDGTVKLAYEDGSFETRYSNGRIRIKDGKGNLISDTMAN